MDLAVNTYFFCRNIYIENRRKKIYITNDNISNYCNDRFRVAANSACNWKWIIYYLSSGTCVGDINDNYRVYRGKSRLFRKFISGKAVIVIQNGVPNIKNLRKLRLSIDRLETRLRQVGISSIEDVKYATIEVSGQLGYELKDNKKPLTKEDFMTLMVEISQMKKMIGSNIISQSNNNEQNNIFQEISSRKFEGNKKEP